MMTAYGWADRSTYLKNIWLRYRLNGEGFQQLWDEQEGKCAGCLGELAHPLVKKLATGLRPEVDHCHKTGVVRGLLCRECNGFLGKVKDNAELLRRLDAYLNAKTGERLI